MIKRTYFIAGKKYASDGSGSFTWHYLHGTYRSFFADSGLALTLMKKDLEKRIDDLRPEEDYQDLEITCFCRC